MKMVLKDGPASGTEFPIQVFCLDREDQKTTCVIYEGEYYEWAHGDLDADYYVWRGF